MASVKNERGAHLYALKNTLTLLQTIEEGEDQSQRAFALRLGVAVGLANALIKRCVQKGLIKVRHVPTRRYAYYLTPKGFREKSHLAAEYLSLSLSFFRRVRAEYLEIFIECERNGWQRVALLGAGELAEIATLAAHQAKITIVAVIDPTRNEPRCAGVRVVSSFSDLGRTPKIDALVIACGNNSQGTFEDAAALVAEGRIMAPPLLHISDVKGHLKKEFIA